jgi:hypothetical protein
VWENRVSVAPSEVFGKELGAENSMEDTSSIDCDCGKYVINVMIAASAGRSLILLQGPRCDRLPERLSAARPAASFERFGLLRAGHGAKPQRRHRAQAKQGDEAGVRLAARLHLVGRYRGECSAGARDRNIRRDPPHV